MRVVFMGTPETAVPPLESLLEHSYDVCAVFTQPDRPAGRGHHVQPGPVKSLAEKKGLTVFQPGRIGSEENRKILEDLRPDFLVVAAYGQILPLWFLKSASVAPLNIHFSLLPKYRGAAPVAYSILNGDSFTGVTIMIMRQELDAGPILAQKKVPIPITATRGDLEKELSVNGAALLIETMDKYLAGSIKPSEQEKSLVSWAPAISRKNARIDWNEDALRIHNRIRAMNPWPGAYTFFRNEPVRLCSSMPEPENPDCGGAPGVYLGISNGGLRVQCGGGGVLRINELQKPSRKRVSGLEFASGVRLRPDEPLFCDRQ
ncbi:MAG: methionyl-tRNA formyltransferase [Acidobacteria bacterium]|nr:methionyl-tRNA formyltransferase [Acidobacteriota bacterium]